MIKRLTPVFTISVVLTLIFILWGAIRPEGLGKTTSSIQTSLLESFGWLYLIAASLFLVFLVYVAFSRFGHIKLGKDTDKPEYNLFTWVAMIFSAGMGIGLVFWGVAEPMTHFQSPPFGEGGTPEAAVTAFTFSYFHWGFHAWAIYGLVALALAYFNFRKGRPQLASELLRPLFGNKVEGGLGHAVNITFVIATVFAIAGPLGMGAIQIGSGLSYLTGVENNIILQLTIIGVVTVLFMLSAQTGLDRGIKYLSITNIVLAISLMTFLMITGPTNFIMDVFTSSFGTYLQNIPSMSLNQLPFESTAWYQGWTIFYWAWWIAAAPFAGSFIARVSKGRTIREFISVVLIIPTFFSLLWFSVFGGTAISLEMFSDFSLSQVMSEQGIEVALFALLGEMPMGNIISFVAIALICTFFITTADSATFVLGIQTTNGNLNPPSSIKFIWGIIQSLAAVVLLLSGGLGSIQSALIISAFPLTIIMILTVFSLFISLKNEFIITSSNVEKNEAEQKVS